MNIWFFLCTGIVIGGIAGYLLATAQNGQKTVGTLRVNDSDPEEAPYLFLELRPDGMSTIERSKNVTLKVDLKTRK